MNSHKKSMMFIRDYTDQGGDIIYLWDGDVLVAVSAEEVVKEESEIICHDYWLIAPVIYRAANRLPKLVTDVEELRISTSGNKNDRELREKIDIEKSLSRFVSGEAVKKYLSIFNRQSAVDETVLAVIGAALLVFSEHTEGIAKEFNEWERFVEIERPVTEQLIRSMSDGIAIDTDKLREHKKHIDFEYYMALKNFSAAYNMPLEVPADSDVVNYLEPRGYDFSGVNVDYVLKFVPMADNFAIDVLNLKKIAKSRKVLNLIPLSQKRIFPITDVFGSITSRIYYKDPSLQNLAKQHRDILCSDPGKKLSYIDFEQYEAGIMGALSGDVEILRLYAEGDLYEAASEEIFQNITRRKEAKRLFLSYAYGMKRQSLYDAAAGYGADRQAVKDFFNRFTGFEKWKVEVHSEFKDRGSISTSLGNHMRRDSEGSLTEQEKRSAVSQVVQGTASLIFKKTLLSLRDETRIDVKVPMHDAVLFEHSNDFDVGEVVRKFSKTMSDHFRGKIVGKASLSNFFAN